VFLAAAQGGGETGGGGARVDQHGRAVTRGQKGQGCLTDTCLLGRERGFALGDRCFDQPDVLGGHRPTVHTAQNAAAVEHVEVAPNGLGGDAETMSQLSDRHSIESHGQIHDRPLAFFGVHD